MTRFNMKQQAEWLGFTDATALLGPAVYLLGFNDEIVWVGKSQMVASRIGNHLSKREFSFDSVYVLPVAVEDLDTVESQLILKFNPRYNIMSPLSLYHKAKQELIGSYDQAAMRRVNAVISLLNHYETTYLEIPESLANEVVSKAMPKELSTTILGVEANLKFKRRV